ncbi:hypothetical protein BDW74DRAFT_96446 [Aspergillus multicolor]|uniref:uncharacterized protein n=1 Tax=Aspergillus multicolor TaxID=41759 RepID=UPI003CCE4448
MLHYLPLEILHMTIREVCAADLSHVCCASKYLYQALLPLLYETLIIKMDELCAGQLTVRSIATCFNNDGSRSITDCLRFAKHLELVAPIDARLGKRCYSGSYIAHPRTRRHWFNNSKLHYNLMEELTHNFETILFHLPGHSLKSFSWHLDLCIPNPIIKTDGWLASKHSGIEKLSIITDGTCYDLDTDLSGLLQLRKLRSISWKGYLTECTIFALFFGKCWQQTVHIWNVLSWKGSDDMTRLMLANSIALSQAYLRRIDKKRAPVRY